MCMCEYVSTLQSILHVTLGKIKIQSKPWFWIHINFKHRHAVIQKLCADFWKCFWCLCLFYVVSSGEKQLFIVRGALDLIWSGSTGEPDLKKIDRFFSSTFFKMFFQQTLSSGVFRFLGGFIFVLVDMYSIECLYFIVMMMIIWVVCLFTFVFFLLNV